MIRKTDWIQTASGVRFYPLEPQPDDIHLSDIATALSKQCRFSGHTNRHYSVAEHSIRVALGVPEHMVAHALLHDASEAYLQDLPRPLKQLQEFNFYRRAEDALQRMIFIRFGLSPCCPPAVERADKAALWHEYQALFSVHLPEMARWKAYGEALPDLALPDSPIIPMSPPEIEAAWLSCLQSVLPRAIEGPKA